MPKISVIIPVYRVEDYLRECLNSVIAQSFTDIEVVCVNDGSDDNSPKILAEYAQRDSRIRVINQENQGLSVARNVGLKNAIGEYIFFLDSDDVIHPKTLEIAYHFAKKYNAELVDLRYTSSNVSSFITKNYDKYKIPHKMSETPFSLGIEYQKFKLLFFVWTKLYKRTLLQGVEFIPKIQFEDYPFVFAVLARKPKTVVVRAKLYFYRARAHSISQAVNPKQIADYHYGINYLYGIYNQSESDLKFFKYKFLPIILKHQLKRCKKGGEEMFVEFAKELRDLQTKELLSLMGNGLLRYFRLIKIIKQYS